MKKEQLTLLFFIFLFTSSFAQKTPKFCGTTDVYNKLLEEHPELIYNIKTANEELEKHTKDYIEVSKNSSERGEIVYTIPVVFHIIHNYGLENISDEQVYDAMRILNEDFNKLNADTSQVISSFKSIIGNANIRFKLAQKDPFGNCTNGITRDASMETYLGNNIWGNTSTADINRWPRNKYLNIWVVAAIENGSAGYTYNPGAVSNNSKLDGIVIINKYIGSIGTSDSIKSRALTHEVGHWLNLKHTWGGTNDPGCDGKTTVTTNPCYGKDNCSADDDVTDTPNTVGSTVCNLNYVSCGALSNVQNYMEYSYCSKMFTQGQASRIRASITSSIAQRSTLWSPSNLLATGTNDSYNSLCYVDFSADKSIACVGQNISFKDVSYNGSNTWTWSFPGANLTGSSLQNPVINYTNPGTYDISLTVGNGIDSKKVEKKGFITILPLQGAVLPFNENFETIQNFSNNWNIQNSDNGVTWQPNNSASTGAYSVKINNFSNDSGRVDVLTSNNIDLKGKKSIVVSFKVAYAQKKSGNNDALKVYVSNDCGKSWSIRFIKTGNMLSGGLTQDLDFIPSASQWQEFKIVNIPTTYFVSNFRIKFEFTSGNGNNIYLDDINIYDPTFTYVKDFSSISSFNIYPNPLEETTTIDFELLKAQKINLSVLDLLGKEITVIKNEYTKEGEHRLNLSKTALGLNKGVYFILLKSDDYKQARKIIVN